MPVGETGMDAGWVAQETAREGAPAGSWGDSPHFPAEEMALAEALSWEPSLACGVQGCTGQGGCGWFGER